jgi:phospholipase/carboxylesterase
VSLLKSKRVGALSGESNSLVVFVHGYGADGSDLIALADPLGKNLPNTTFIAPDAPHRCSVNPIGYEWFPIPWMDGSSEEQARQTLYETAGLFDDWLTATIRDEDVTSASTVLFGFSQGTMLSLHQGIRRPNQLAGIVGFSGRLLEPDALADVAASKPPILLVHGDMDMVVPPSEMPLAEMALRSAGFDVETHVSEGTGHGIASDGLGRALHFLKRHLPG